jgi:histidinol-phosphatase
LLVCEFSSEDEERVNVDFETQRRYVTACWGIKQAGQLTWDYFTRGVEIELKSDETPVTVADKECESHLRATLSNEFPGDGFVGEEHGVEPTSTGFRWIIDPIDATANFIRGIPIYATLLGLEYEGSLVAGLCYVPATRTLYHAMSGKGAFKDDKRIHVSNVSRLEDSQLCYAELKMFDRTGTSDFFTHMTRSVKRSRGFGDYWQFLLVAEGAADIVLEPIAAYWDLAALLPIVEEAGGVFTDFDGNRTANGGAAIAANPTLHALVMEKRRQFSK